MIVRLTRLVIVKGVGLVGEKQKSKPAPLNTKGAAPGNREENEGKPNVEHAEDAESTEKKKGSTRCVRN